MYDGSSLVPRAETFGGARFPGAAIQSELSLLGHDVVGPRIILTSLILMGGFGSMAVSEYLPTANFGMFSCLTTFAALVMDLTVLPLALSVRGGAAPASQARLVGCPRVRRGSRTFRWCLNRE